MWKDDTQRDVVEYLACDGRGPAERGSTPTCTYPPVTLSGFALEYWASFLSPEGWSHDPQENKCTRLAQEAVESNVVFTNYLGNAKEKTT